MDNLVDNCFGGQRSEQDHLPATEWAPNGHDLFLNLQSLQEVPSEYGYDVGPVADLREAPPSHNNATQLSYAYDPLAQPNERTYYQTSNIDQAFDTLASPFQYPSTPQNTQSHNVNTSWLDIDTPGAPAPRRSTRPRVEETCHRCQHEDVKQLRELEHARVQEAQEAKRLVIEQNQELENLRSRLAHIESHSIPNMAYYISSLSSWAEATATGNWRPPIGVPSGGEGHWRQSGNNRSSREIDEWDKEDDESPMAPRG